MDAPPSYDDAEKGGKGVTFSCPAESMSQWLANHQLDRYRDAFERGGFNSIEDLMNAKEDDLDALGLALGHKRRFLAAVSRTRMGGVGVPAPAYSEVQGETKKVEVDLSGTSAYIRDHLTDSMGMTYDHDGKGTYINLVGNSYRGGHNHGGFFHGRGIYTYTNGETCVNCSFFYFMRL